MLRFNAAENLNRGQPKWSLTDQGFMRIECDLLKAGHEMLYKNAGTITKETIPKAELFSEETKKSFLHQTVTLEHPKKYNKLAFVDSGNIGEFKKGTIIDVYKNGDCLGATVQVEDKEAVEKIKTKINNNEIIQVSAGYEAQEKITGKNEKEQIGIKGNHVAILFDNNGRAGNNARLIYNNIDEYFGGNLMSLNFNGKVFNTGEELLIEANNVLESKNKVEKDLKSVQVAKDGIEAKFNTADKELEEIKVKYNSLQAETSENEIRSAASNYIEFDEKDSTLDIMKNLIKEDNPKFNSDDFEEVEELRGLFNYTIERLDCHDEVKNPVKNSKYNSVDGEKTTKERDFYRNYGIKKEVK